MLNLKPIAFDGTIEPVAGKTEYVLRSPDVLPGPKNNWLTRIGSTEERFVPHIRIERWGNAWFEVADPTSPLAFSDVSFHGNVLMTSAVSYGHRWYTLRKDGEDALEWEIILNERPKSDVLVFNLSCSPNLFFWKQATEHIFPGQTVPEKVQGSYAVYYDRRDGPYKTGKFLHIYRPELIDASGDRVWAELDIDIKAGTMTITMPGKWLDDAVYPVTVDPTYGHTGNPVTSSDAEAGQALMAIPNAAMSELGYAQSVHVYGKKSALATVDPDISFGYYDNAANHARKDLNGTDTVSAAAYTWFSQAMNSTTMSAGVRYAIVVLVETDFFNVPYDNAATTDIRTWSGKSSPLPAVLGEASAAGSWNDAFVVGMYVTYSTPSGWAVGDVNGVVNANLGAINGVDLADISEVNGA